MLEVKCIDQTCISGLTFPQIDLSKINKRYIFFYTNKPRRICQTKTQIVFDFCFQARKIAGIEIFRFEQSLFFLNKDHFRTLLYKKTINPNTLKIARDKVEKKLRKSKKKVKNNFDIRVHNFCRDVFFWDSFKISQRSLLK